MAEDEWAERRRAGYSRRFIVTGAAAGLVVSASSPAARAHPAYEPLARAIEGDIDHLSADPVAVISRLQGHLRRAADAGLFDTWREDAIVENDKFGLLSGGGHGRKWKVQLFRIAAGRSHPPHCHENLASCLVVLDGRLRIREYERLRELETSETTTLRMVRDDALVAGGAILTAEEHRNAHWFGADGGPALAVNLKASGYFRPELMRLQNRRYLDPADEAGGLITARFIPSAEAKARYGRRSL